MPEKEQASSPHRLNAVGDEISKESAAGIRTQNYLDSNKNKELKKKAVFGDPDSGRPPQNEIRLFRPSTTPQPSPPGIELPPGAIETFNTEGKRMVHWEELPNVEVEYTERPIEEQIDIPKAEPGGDTLTHEEQTNIAKFETVIALGKNWRLPISGEEQIFLSLESKITTREAAQMVADGSVERIILSTGKTAGKDRNGNEYPSEAAEMKKELRAHFTEEQVPDEKIILQDSSFDTAGDAEEDRKIVDEKGFERIALVTVFPHTIRSSRLFQNYGVNVSKTFDSLSLMEQRGHHYEQFIKEYRRSKKFLKELIVESIGTSLVYTIDPKGNKIVRKMSSKTRSREDN